MLSDDLIDVASYLFGLPGAALVGYSIVVAIGKVPVPHGRAWGSAATMSRGRFALYFGALGLSWMLSMNLVADHRDSPHFVALVSIPALALLCLIAGWLVMVRSGGSVQ
jgi:hypothetical protein